jgi:hypothetical protein
MRRAVVIAAVAALSLAGFGCSSGDDSSKAERPSKDGGADWPERDDDLKLNQIQVIGTHNSFHVATTGKEHELLEDLNAEQAAEREYTHAEIPVQLEEQKVRQFEFDVFADAKGGLYADPVLRAQADLGPYEDEEPSITKPGTKVLHEQDVDYRSVCPLLVDCLRQVETWSDDHPDHVPIAIDLQFKDGGLIFDVPGQAVPEKWNPESMAALDDEIRSVFDPEDLITPDDIRGDHATLEEAVLAGEWPTLGESRGKVLFQILNGEPYRTIYRNVGGVPPEGEDGLEGQVMFTNAQPGSPDASFVSVDDAVEDADRIDDLVSKGYVVRTRADEPNQQGRTGDTEARDAALASGAQWISTDHPGPDGAEEQYGTDYVAQLPGFLPARCNPVTAPDDCDDESVEP